MSLFSGKRFSVFIFQQLEKHSIFIKYSSASLNASIPAPGLKQLLTKIALFGSERLYKLKTIKLPRMNIQTGNKDG